MQVLKEQIRRYKHRAQDAERQSEKQEQRLLVLGEQVKKLKAQLAEGAASPEALAAEQQLRQQADTSARALEVSKVVFGANTVLLPQQWLLLCHKEHQPLAAQQLGCQQVYANRVFHGNGSVVPGKKAVHGMSHDSLQPDP